MDESIFPKKAAMETGKCIKPVYQEFTARLVMIYLHMILFGFWFFQTTESYN